MPIDQRPRRSHCEIGMAKTHARGCITKRPCCCDRNKDRARAFRPIRWFWPWVRGNRRPGEFLPKKVIANNANRRIRHSFSALRAPSAQRYSSHGFGRGAAQELKESGAQWPVAAAAGNWKGLSFRPYVDLSGELADGIAQLSTEPYNFDSDEEEGAITQVPRWA